MPSGDGGLKSRSLHERRHDQATADTVDVALLYLQVFGANATRQYLPLTDLPPAIVRRILAREGLRRRD